MNGKQSHSWVSLVLGIFGVGVSSFGAYYDHEVLQSAGHVPNFDNSTPILSDPVFLTMFGSSVTTQLFLLTSSIGLLVSRKGRWLVCYTVAVFVPLVGIMITGTLWLSKYGEAIASNTGIALGGCVLVLLTLMPLWVPFLTIPAYLRVKKTETRPGAVVSP